MEKSGHELVLDEADESRIFPVSGYTIGYVRDVSHGKGLDIGLGTQFTINDHPGSLDRYYGDDLGYAFQFFLRSARRSTAMADTGTPGTLLEWKNKRQNSTTNH